MLNTLTVGHGKIYNAARCTSAPDDCINGDPIYELPTHMDEYLSWVDAVNSAAIEEATALGVQDNISIVGLSLGSALATAALARTPTDGSWAYKRAVVFPPFYGVSVPNIDRAVQNCAGTKDECIAKFVQSIVDGSSEVPEAGATPTPAETSDFGRFLTDALNYFVTEDTLDGGYQSLQSALRYALSAIAGASDDFYSFLFSPLTSQAFGWGDQCESDRTNLGRGGYCSFKIANLLAVHAAGEWALAAAMNGEIKLANGGSVQFVPVERDGYTRNGAVVQAAQGIANGWSHQPDRVHMAIYRVEDGCDPDARGSECGIPHSCIAPGELSFATRRFDRRRH